MFNGRLADCGGPSSGLTGECRIRFPDPLIKVNDTVKIDLATGKITDFIKFDTGVIAMVTGGRNMGRVGVVTHRERHDGGFNIVHIKDAIDNTFATRESNVFVIGSDKSWISLPKGKGVQVRLRRPHSGEPWELTASTVALDCGGTGPSPGSRTGWSLKRKARFGFSPQSWIVLIGERSSTVTANNSILHKPLHIEEAFKELSCRKSSSDLGDSRISVVFEHGCVSRHLLAKLSPEKGGGICLRERSFTEGVVNRYLRHSKNFARRASSPIRLDQGR